jgi:tetratricopeptide (TPR) repeat protein
MQSLDIMGSMRNLRDLRILSRLLLLLVLIPLLGLSTLPHNASLNLKNAYQAMRNGFLHQAAGQLAAAASQLSGRDDLWESAGRYALQGNDPQDAINYLQNAANQKPSAARLILLGNAYQKAGDLRAAILAWERALQIGGDAPQVYPSLWQAQQQVGDYSSAIQSLKALLHTQNGEARLPFQLGLLLATQQPEAALPYLSQAADNDASLKPEANALSEAINQALVENDPAYMLLAAGRALATLNHWDLSVEAFHQACLQRPDYAEAWAYLGEALQHQASVTDASQDRGLAELQKALALDPHSLVTNTFLGLYWQRHQEYEQALQSFQTAANLDPQNPVFQAEIGNTLAQMGNLAEAQAAHQKAIDLAPNDPSYLHQMAAFSLKYEYQLHQLALPAARRAVILSPNDAATLDLMGQVLFKLNDLIDSGRFFERALQANSQYAPAHLHLGLLLLYQSDPQRAYQELTLARTLDPNGQTAEQSERLLQTYFP